MKRIILLFSICFCFAVGAMAQKTTYKFQDTQARLLDVISSAYVKPLTVELKVKTTTRIRHKLHLAKDVVESEMKGDIQNIRSYAVFDASRAQNCDVIVAATFNIKTDDSNNGYDIEVVGYPADFVNWKTATPQDYEWIKMEKVQTTSEREKIGAVVKK